MVELADGLHFPFKPRDLVRPGHVELEMQLPDDDEVLTLRGRKVYENGQTVGVRFVDLLDAEAFREKVATIWPRGHT